MRQLGATCKIKKKKRKKSLGDLTYKVEAEIEIEIKAEIALEPGSDEEEAEDQGEAMQRAGASGSETSGIQDFLG
jgi:hypothetical protein